MGDIVITHWAKYGHQRGYATAADGTKLGWVDLKTGAVTLEDGADAVAVTAALEAWGATQAQTPAQAGAEVRVALEQVSPALVVAEPLAIVAPTTPQVPQQASVPAEVVAPVNDAPAALAPTQEPTWRDLAAHRPGQLVREQAAAEWAASKDRSKFLAYGARVFNVHTDERAWRVGADGEEAVGARLEKLRGKGWYLLHSVPVGKNDSDIDHVAIGPGGVFTLNTKNHPGGKIWVAKYQMRVNGQVVPYLRNANHEATRASKLLTKAAGFEVSVRSCVVVLTGTIIPEVNIKQMPDDVMVLDRMDVPRWFNKRPAVLKPEQVEAIYAVARRSDTWV
jgi:Nuclease-related domain